MSNFTPSAQRIFEFDGDTVTVELKSLTRKAMMAMAPYVGDGENIDQTGLFDVASDHLPEHIQSMNGLTDRDGNEISVAVMLDNSYFMPLVADIISSLFELSQLTETEVKNSSGQPNTSIGEPVTSEA